MRAFIILVLLIVPFSVSAEFIHPMDFNGTESQKQKVIEIIKKRVRKDYCDSGLDMCQESTLRMMERQNLGAFKQATQATNRKIMDRMIKDYCNSGLDMCSYSNIWMMYKQNLKASKESLSW